MRHLLSTLRYWRVSSIPKELVSFVARCTTLQYHEVFLEFQAELLYLELLDSLAIKIAGSAAKLTYDL